MSYGGCWRTKEPRVIQREKYTHTYVFCGESFYTFLVLIYRVDVLIYRGEVLVYHVEACSQVYRQSAA